MKVPHATRWFVRGSAVLILLLLAVGCDGSSRSSKTTTSAPPPPTSTGITHADWRARADQICAEAFSQLVNLPQPKSFQQFAHQLALATNSFDRAIDGLRRLPVPAADAARVRKFLAALQANAKTVQNAHRAALRRDRKAVRAAIAAGNQPALRVGELAYDLGLQYCRLPG